MNNYPQSVQLQVLCNRSFMLHKMFIHEQEIFKSFTFSSLSYSNKSFIMGCPRRLLSKTRITLTYMGCSKKTKQFSVIPKLRYRSNHLIIYLPTVYTSNCHRQTLFSGQSQLLYFQGCNIQTWDWAGSEAGHMMYVTRHSIVQLAQG